MATMLLFAAYRRRILRGDRIGIIGPNGCGKSTLLKLILGEIAPTSGEVVMGTRLKLAYFDQHRRELNPEKTVRENMTDGSDYVTVQRTFPPCHRLPERLSFSAPAHRLAGASVVRRRAQSFVAGKDFYAVGEHVGAGRADQRFGRGDARTIGRPAGRLPGNACYW